MKSIPLSQGKFAQVDDADYDDVARYKWCYINSGGCEYATRTLLKDEASRPGEREFLHRRIMGLGKGDKRVVDHKDSDGLNCQRANMRVCTQQENLANRRVRRTKIGGLKGAYTDKRDGSWFSEIVWQGKARYLGRFATSELAHEFYCLAADMLHGEFARHN